MNKNEFNYQSAQYYEQRLTHHLDRCEKLFYIRQQTEARAKIRKIEKTFNYHFLKAQEAERRAIFYTSQLKKQK